MRNDLELIVHKLPKEMTHMNLYPLGDLHLGSPVFDKKHFEKWMGIVLADENAKVVLVGDLIENSLKHSKTSPYEVTMQPFAQKQELKRIIKELDSHGKLLGAVQGNHCARSSDVADMCPLYESMESVGVDDLYRKNLAILKISLGERNKERQVTYSVVLHHGGSKNRMDKFSLAMDNVSVFLSGHTHTGSVTFPSKLVVDLHNDKVTTQTYINLVVPAFTPNSGYALKALYAPQGTDIIPYLRFDGTKKDISVHWV